ncbi:MAG TPA: penicillin acylase family protein [Candidatus Baltobacteraceae bacterium]|nr:penicillin acylase family protein [Candidatus Baltobacteraceae bacterium]
MASCLYAADIGVGLHVSAQVHGTITGFAVQRDVLIARDRRDIPHIRARTIHDLFFAQGFVEGSDRLFQMDVTRRYAHGTLSELFGARALPIDEELRAFDIRHTAALQWEAAGISIRRALEAFSAGVNAAELRQPLPVEFRMLRYRPAPWTPQDSIAVSVVAALELSDSWHDVVARDERWRALSRPCFDLEFPLSDSRYDVFANGEHSRAPLAERALPNCSANAISSTLSRPHTGSNAWGAGGARNVRHRALIANDPHVDLTIPGVWYMIDLQAPGFHAAGAVIPGLPGVTLGHNERVAWAVTNAQVATTVVYRLAKPPAGSRMTERFVVRFGSPVSKIYYRTATAFSVPRDDDIEGWTFVRWPPYWQRASTIAAALDLDRATNIAAAMRVLSNYRGSPENFVVGDTTGCVAYHLAGAIPDDPAWGRYVHSARDMSQQVHLIAFRDLPFRRPSSSATLLNANNLMYGPGYPHRLSAAFEPPYRAYRIASLLSGRRVYDWRYFAKMQLDTYSPVDAEIAREIAGIARSDVRLRGSNQEVLLSRWNGYFHETSTAASLEHYVRADLQQHDASFASLLAKLRNRGDTRRADIAQELVAALWPPQQRPRPWGDVGSLVVEHPLSTMWYGLLRGASLPGDGDEYTIHLEEPGFAQGFRAVWDVGDWDSGGIVIPSGESGQPGSVHYDDLAKTWITGKMIPLPFSRAAVRRETLEALTLRH